jgi:hypothetical protein
VANGQKSATAKDSLKTRAENTRHDVGKFAVMSTSALTPHPRNPRRHTREQIRAIARSIETFGFNAPILIDKNKRRQLA